MPILNVLETLLDIIQVSNIEKLSKYTRGNIIPLYFKARLGVDNEMADIADCMGRHFTLQNENRMARKFD